AARCRSSRPAGDPESDFRTPHATNRQAALHCLRVRAPLGLVAVAVLAALVSGDAARAADAKRKAGPGPPLTVKRFLPKNGAKQFSIYGEAKVVFNRAVFLGTVTSDTAGIR